MAEHGNRVKDAVVVHNASNPINTDGQLSILEYAFRITDYF
jgi:hypothetical protein